MYYAASGSSPAGGRDRFGKAGCAAKAALALDDGLGEFLNRIDLPVTDDGDERKMVQEIVCDFQGSSISKAPFGYPW